MLLMPGILTFAWGGVIQMMADAAGAKLDDIKEIYERLPAPHDIEIELGTIKQGPAAALRFELQGIVNGRPAIIVEPSRVCTTTSPRTGNTVKAAAATASKSPRPHDDHGFHITGADGDHNTGGLLASAMRLIHAIPAVVAAPPGLLSTLDLLPVRPLAVFG